VKLGALVVPRKQTDGQYAGVAHRFFSYTGETMIAVNERTAEQVHQELGIEPGELAKWIFYGCIGYRVEGGEVYFNIDEVSDFYAEQSARVATLGSDEAIVILAGGE
jgi:hypothetical protein